MVSSTALADAASPTSPGLTARLLTVKQLGRGWVTVSPAGFTAGLPRCLTKLYDHAVGQDGEARRTFSGAGGVRTYQDRLVTFARDADRRTAAFQSDIAGCPAKSAGVRISVRRLVFKTVGRQAKAYLVELTIPGHRAWAVVGIARQGRTVIVSTDARRSAAAAQGKRFATEAIAKAA